MSPLLRYLKGYPDHIVTPVNQMIESQRFEKWFEQRYPNRHNIKSDKSLYDFTMAIKNRFMRKSSPISKVIYDKKIHVINNALGLHSYVNRAHGSKIKSKNEIRISDIFRSAPEELLRMLVVHELAHLKEKDHNKAFYQLCCHMEPDYHQLELDARLFMIYLELKQN